MYTLTLHDITPLIDDLIAFVGHDRLKKSVATWRNALQNARPAERIQQEKAAFYWWRGLAEHWQCQASGDAPTLATQLLAKDAMKIRDLLPTMPASVKKQFAGALGDARNAASHLHEISMAHHCLGLGGQIDWCEESGQGIPEFVARFPELEFDVECKYLSPDIGRRVARAEFVRFAATIEPQLRKCRVMGHVHFALHDGLPHAAKYAHVAATLRSAIAGGLQVGRLDMPPWGEAHLAIRAADNVPIDWDAAQPAFRAAAPVQGHALVHAQQLTGQPANPIVLSVASAEKDAYLHAVYCIMKEAAQRQLSGTRAGLLCIHIPEINDFSSLMDESGLRQITAYFFAKPEHAHVFAVAYTSDTHIIDEPTGFRTTASALAFKNGNCRFLSASSFRLFGQEELPPELSPAWLADFAHMDDE